MKKIIKNNKNLIKMEKKWTKVTKNHFKNVENWLKIDLRNEKKSSKSNNLKKKAIDRK